VRSEERAELGRRVAGLPELARARLRERGAWALLSREGPLLGAADWTHQHADAANTRTSRDERVKAPLGLLWFGGPGNENILPRHGHGPQPQALDGRLFIEGANGLRAIDVYTGRLLWEAHLPGLGRPYDNLSHQAGANASGGNYVSTREGIHVAYRGSCVVLNPATGKETRRFVLPAMPGEREAPAWSFLTAHDRYLVGGASPAAAAKKRGARPPVVWTSKRLTVLDRRSGAVLWEAHADGTFRNNAICIGGGRLYAIDRVEGPAKEKKGKKAKPEVVQARLVAFDLATGKVVWERERGVFGTWLSCSEGHDVLVESGRPGRDTLFDEPAGMRAYRASTGEELWYHKNYIGPAMIRGGEVLKSNNAGASAGSACDLLTGRPVLKADPLTGEQAVWSWSRMYGCNTPAASQHLLTFRSGAAGYCDLDGAGGTGNLGGFRSSCTNNLLVACGVLTAPDYTRTCTCSYQNQTSLGLVHDPDAEMWTFFGTKQVKGRVRQVGINLGAPGSRRSPAGTLWLEHPPVGAPSPRLAVRTVPAKVETFRQHSGLVEGSGLKWVGASGARGLREVRVKLGGKGERARKYTVRLHFREPDRLGAGERVFDVALQGRTVLEGLDVSHEAGGPNRVLVKEVQGVAVGEDLVVTLTARRGEPVLSGVEAIAEGW
jgi:outer membrane protein assembly factor BamB